MAYLLYTTAALIFLWLGYATNNLYFAIVFYWIGTSLSLVAMAYLFNIPRIFRKSVDGTIPIYIRWLFIPFLLGSQLYNSWMRKRDQVPALQKIDDNLFLACRLFPSDMDTLSQNKITAILDVTAEFDGLDWSSHAHNFHYLNIPVLDHQSPSLNQLQHALNWIQTHINNHRNVVVHCALGRGRSVLVVIAYLLLRNKYATISQAQAAVNKIRKTANLNSLQTKRLGRMLRTSQISRNKKAALIANPIAGGQKWHKYQREIIQRLTTQYVIDIYETTPDIDANIQTQNALKQGHSLVVACGGDGTVSEVASQLDVNKHTLGIIPLGTTNALCHVLQGSVSKLLPIETSCEVLLNGTCYKMDTIQCNEELCLLNVCLGMGHKMIALADREQKNQSGQIAYLKGLWQAMIEEETLNLTLQINEQTAKVKVTSLCIANAAPFSTLLAQGNGLPNWNDGELDITILPSAQADYSGFSHMTELAINGITQSSNNINVLHQQAKQVKITSDNTLQYALDGEIRNANSITLTIQPQSLKVLARNQDKN